VSRKMDFFSPHATFPQSHIIPFLISYLISYLFPLLFNHIIFNKLIFSYSLHNLLSPTTTSFGYYIVLPLSFENPISESFTSFPLSKFSMTIIESSFNSFVNHSKIQYTYDTNIKIYACSQSC
jgi:hypothetical protein